MDRRSALVTSAVAIAIGVAACATAPAPAPTPAGAMKMSVMYPAPPNPAEFDKYYVEKHMPVAREVKGVRFELSKLQPGANGAAPPYYRLTEIYFDSPDHMRAALASPEWARMMADFRTFAPPGVTVYVSRIE